MQRRGSSITPSFTPSSPSQASIAARVAAASLQEGIGFEAVFINIEPQSDDTIKFDQFTAGAAAAMPS